MATNQPFTFLILGAEATPELEALSALGHTLIYCDRITFSAKGVEATAPIDKVVGPNAWRLLPDQMKWVPLIVKEMRALQPKPKKVKKEKL